MGLPRSARKDKIKKGKIWQGNLSKNIVANANFNSSGQKEN